MNYEELVKTQSTELIKKVIAHLTGEDSVEIHHDFQGDDQWAIVSMFNYDEDQEISIRLHPDDLYDLHFGYYDEEDDFYTIVHPFTAEEKKLLPEALRKVMLTVLAKEEGMRLPGSLLTKK